MKIKSLFLGALLTMTADAGQFDMEIKSFDNYNISGTVRVDDFSTHTYVSGRIQKTISGTYLELQGALWPVKDKFPDGEREGRITRLDLNDHNSDGIVDSVYQERTYFISRGRINIRIPNAAINIYRHQMDDSKKKLYDDMFKSAKEQLVGGY